MKIQKYFYPALLAGAVLLPVAAMAQQTTTANLEVSIKINGICTLSAAPLAFAGQTGLAIGANVDATANVTVNCTDTATYELGFGPGNNNQGSRRMADGSGNNFINYDIYEDFGRTNVLTALGGGTTLSGSGDGLDQTLVVYGRVPPQTATAVGDYTDQVVMTLEY